jgi:CRP-like cAMP-binding protein
LYNFKQFFTFSKDNNLKKNTYSWEEDQFLSFMIKILQNLEPRLVYAKEYIYKENEEVEEIYFVMSGEYVVGYTVANKECWAKKLGVKSVIGDRCVMFCKKSEFIYKAIKDLHCYVIRKAKVFAIFSKYPTIA